MTDPQRWAERARRSAAHFRKLAEEAEAFAQKVDDGLLVEGDEFLDVEGVEENGYDRTGPDLVAVENGKLINTVSGEEL